MYDVIFYIPSFCTFFYDNSSNSLVSDTHMLKSCVWYVLPIFSRSNKTLLKVNSAV